MTGRRRRLAIFRPREKLAESVALAEARGYEVVAVPMIETRAVRGPEFASFLRALRDGGIDVVVFTSANGVPHAFDAAKSSMTEDEFRSALVRARVLAIGPATRRALADAGVPSEVPLEHSSRGLVEHFARRRIAAKRVALLRSRQGSPELPEGLQSLGYDVTDVPLYDVGLPTDLEGARAFFARLVRGEVDSYAFLSAGTVRNFFELAAAVGVEDEARAALSRAPVAAIGGPTREALEREGIRVAVTPPTATFAALLDALEKGNV